MHVCLHYNVAATVCDVIPATAITYRPHTLAAIMFGRLAACIACALTSLITSRPRDLRKLTRGGAGVFDRLTADI